ncbi:28S ribosomal protein S18b, mitochondrial [Ctenocephalides felis]|uniref:28S ribosomal protein S18b, mitochondrial n=1 Tax=Ctenocephalides felis TaxID=7515 RepID=UPI000E6E216E|nr:28S ribosomal protein S18b, mitochondrial [Ctenocephalides felis]
MFRYVRSIISSCSQVQSVINYNVTRRGFQISATNFCENSEGVDQEENSKPIKEGCDRRTAIPVETSIKYMKSEAYKKVYGDQAVWVQYRRNHKGMFPPRKTRKTCIRGGVISTGNPCPICRDEYLVLNENNTDLLKQFISPHTGEVLSYSKTGLCQKRHLELLVATERAKDCGLIIYDLPTKEYDYSEYYKDFDLTALEATKFKFHQ